MLAQLSKETFEKENNYEQRECWVCVACIYRLEEGCQNYVGSQDSLLGESAEEVQVNFPPGVSPSHLQGALEDNSSGDKRHGQHEGETEEGAPRRRKRE
eukprot:2894862-Rhodomonas_salina.1